MQIYTEDSGHGMGYASHGTECAPILCKYCKDCDIVSIRILDEEKKNCNIEKLITALEWCIDNEIYICSLSLGSTEFREQILLNDSKRNYNGRFYDKQEKGFLSSEFNWSHTSNIMKSMKQWR